MRAWTSLLGIVLGSCTGSIDPEDTTNASDPTQDSGSETEVSVGGFALRGEVLDVYTWTRTGGGLCLRAADAGPIVRGESLEPSEPVVVAENGTWLIEDLTSTSTAGIYLLLDDCEGETGAFPTATLLLPETWAGRGPEDTITGVVAHHISDSRLESWEEALDRAGNSWPIETYGAFMGHIEDLEGDPMVGAWLLSSETSRFYYDLGDGDWGLWSAENGTTLSGAGRFAVPDSTWGSYIAKGLGTDYIPLLLGGLPNYVIYHRWEAQVSDYGDSE